MNLIFQTDTRLKLIYQDLKPDFWRLITVPRLRDKTLEEANQTNTKNLEKIETQVLIAGNAC